MTANVPMKFLFEVSSNMVSGDDSAKKSTQSIYLSISSKYVAVTPIAWFQTVKD